MFLLMSFLHSNTFSWTEALRWNGALSSITVNSLLFISPVLFLLPLQRFPAPYLFSLSLYLWPLCLCSLIKCPSFWVVILLILGNILNLTSLKKVLMRYSALCICALLQVPISSKQLTEPRNCIHLKPRNSEWRHITLVICQMYLITLYRHWVTSLVQFKDIDGSLCYSM